MLLKDNGIEVQVGVKGNDFIYKVISQTAEATRLLRQNDKAIRDEKTGLGLYSNKFPSWGPKGKCFFVRGSSKSKDSHEVKASFGSPEEAREAMNAFIGLMTQIKPSEYMVPVLGGTTHVRQALITNEQAKILQLTGHKHYPKERNWKATKSIVTENIHYNEHIGQVTDVLNKSLSGRLPAGIKDGVVNHHKVTGPAALFAVQEFKSLFDRAEHAGKNHLVALWRLVSGMRAPDIDNDENDNNDDN